MIWFSSDSHWGHTNIIKYSKRPFSTCSEMDEALIKNWNDLVTSDDLVYHLGDFGFYPSDKNNWILSRLNGHKFLLLGNHDKKKRIPSQYISHLGHYYELEVKDPDAQRGNKQLIVLCHYAFETWNKQHHGSWHLHGHSHHTLPSNKYQRRLDVGVDGHNYKPISYQQVKEIMSKKVFKPVDHHRTKDDE